MSSCIVVKVVRYCQFESGGAGVVCRVPCDVATAELSQWGGCRQETEAGRGRYRSPVGRRRDLFKHGHGGRDGKCGPGSKQ